MNRMLRAIPLHVLLLSTCLLAQFDTATVIGTVHDQGGAVIPNSKVTLISSATGVTKTTNTDTSGNYTFFDVKIGKYTLRAESTGFKASVASEFTVTVNAHQRVDLNLQIGDVSERVVVEAAASAIETDSSNRGQVINQEAIVNLPLNGRSYADLTLLVPGARKSLLQDGTAAARDASYNVNGQRSALNNFMLDGVDNNSYGTSNQGFSNQVVQITPDAVAEFRVETSNFSAEYGRAAGAVINASTKSGSNAIHGAAWEYLRNTELNAVGFFKPALGVKPIYQQNQFGGAIGGPIKKDKLFYFMDYEGLRRTTRSLTFATLPTDAQKAGNLGTPVRNAITGETYGDGNVPAAAISPFARAVLAALPSPNQPGNSNNYQSLPRTTIGDNKGDVRLDYYWNDKITSYFRFSHREDNLYVPANIPGPAGGNANGNVHIFNQQWNPGTTWTINSTSVLEARLGLTWTEGGKSPIGLGEPSLLDANGITGLPKDARVMSALNSQSVNGFSQFGRQASNPQFQNPYNLNPKVVYSKLLGRHTLKFGYEYQRLDTAVDDFNPVYGNDSYSGQFSRPAGTASTSNAALTQAYNLADFLTGARASYELNNYVIVDLRQRLHFGYVQDDFKFSNKLTFNIGLRYETSTPQYEKDNHLANFDPATNTLIQAKDGSLYDRSLVNRQKNNWAPRFGLAYQVDKKTVIRSAYGISYVQFNRLGGENLLAYNGPYIVDALITQDPANLPICASAQADPLTCFRTTQQGYPANFASPSNFNPIRVQSRYIPKNNPTGYIQSWHYTMQREVVRNLIVEAAYVGNKGTHIMLLGDQNQARPNNVGETTSLQARRPIPQFGGIEVAMGAGYSNYHALQTKIEKRYSSGLYLLNSFTFSKAIDNASGHLEVFSGDSSRVNIQNLTNEKGVSAYHQKFNDTFSAVYAIPVGRGRKYGSSMNSVVDAIVGGWQMTAINTLTSGIPINLTYNPTAQFQVSSVGLSYRPNVTGDPVNPNWTASTFLLRGPVTIPTDPSHPFGTAGRNALRGPGLFQLDLGLHKEFKLHENIKLQFRSEAFNLQNRTNFTAPDGNISNSSYGTITTTFPARQIQFAAKIVF